MLVMIDYFVYQRYALSFVCHSLFFICHEVAKIKNRFGFTNTIKMD